MGNPLDPGWYCSADLRSFGFDDVGDDVRVARNCNVIGPENIRIGDNVRIDAFSTLIASAGFIRMGSHIHIGGYTHMVGRGGLTMGDYSGTSQRVSIYTATDEFSGRHLTGPAVPAELTGCRVRPIRLGRHAAVGSGAVVLPGAHFGDGAVLGALSLACRPIPPWEVHSGTPAVRFRARRRDLLALEPHAEDRIAHAA